MISAPLKPADSAVGNRSGETIAGTYCLLECIGSGGMGDVYAAEHRRLKKRFAVKLLRSRGGHREDRFRREARAIARVENEHVVSVIDYGETRDGTPYIVMELLRGQDLRELLAHAAPLPIPRAVSLIRGACYGVAAVHRAGLVHRDLKPGNLFVARRASGEDWCKVLDFGVAKTDTTSSTLNGGLVGTVKYMAPEQLENGAAVSPAVDVYALGAILYECLSGDSPHSGETVQELMFKIMNEAPKRLSERCPHVPAELSAVVARALEKEPNKRFPSVDDFAAVLEPFARPSLASSDDPGALTLAEPSLPRARDRRASLTRAGAVVVALCASGAWLLHRSEARIPRADAPSKVGAALASAAMPVEKAMAPDAVPRQNDPPLQSSADARPTSEPSARTAPVISRPIRTHATIAPQSRFDTTNPYEH